MRRGPWADIPCPAVPFADVNGVRLYHEEQGEGEPLLCVMGLASDHRAGACSCPRSPSASGRSSSTTATPGARRWSTPTTSITDLADDVLGLADALGLDRFHLLGISLGSASRSTSRCAPKRIRTLTLAATWGGTAPAYAQMRAASGSARCAAAPPRNGSRR